MPAQQLQQQLHKPLQIKAGKLILTQPLAALQQAVVLQKLPQMMKLNLRQGKMLH